MKAVLISDIHFGAMKNSDMFFASQKRLFTEQLIPYMNENGIKDMFILGDLYNNRDHINIKILSETYKLFSEDLKDFNIRIILGNHDIYYKTTVEVNSIQFLSALPNITVVDDVTIDEPVFATTGKKILMVPWQVDPIGFINRVSNKNLGCDYCFGHFELTSFNLNKSTICDGGINPEFMYDNFDKTFSGHFHRRSYREHEGKYIQYIGSPYHITRHDIGEERGFTVVDFVDGTQTFIENTKSIKYLEIKFPEVFDKKTITGNIVDVLIKYDENYDEALVQHYIKIIEKHGPAVPPNIKIENMIFKNATQEFQGIQTIDELIEEYVNSLPISNKGEVLNNVMNLYRQCSRG